MQLQEWADIGQVVSGAATVVILIQLVLQLRKDKDDRNQSAKSFEAAQFARIAEMTARDQALLDAHDAHRKEMEALKRQISYETYMRANERYLHYLEICLQNPSLDIFDYPDHLPLDHRPEHPRQSLIAYAILIGTLEHGYVCSLGQDDELGKKQHCDWLWYIKDWASKPGFQAMWKRMREGYDDRFVQCTDQFVDSAVKSKKV